MQGKTETTVGLFVLAALAIFVYMGLGIGAFRLDRSKYASYIVWFKDVGGLSRKGDVKIAGVKIGWVENIQLPFDDQAHAQATVVIKKEYLLYSNAAAVVRQQGMLGPTYLEIVPGNPLLPVLVPGSALNVVANAPPSTDELMQQFKHIAANVQDVTQTFKNALGSGQQDQLTQLLENMSVAARNMASVSQILERSLSHNQENIDTILELGKDFKRISQQLELEIFPAFKESLNKVSKVFDREFDRIATKLESTGDALLDASQHARDGMQSINSVAGKIDEGQGFIGKLINEDDVYNDIKSTAYSLKNYFDKINRLQIIFDSHFESMHRPAEDYPWEDGKGYFDMRIHPNQDYFYLVQLASSVRGYFNRHKVEKYYRDDAGRPVDKQAMELTDAQKLRFTFDEELLIVNRDSYKFGLQFGKIFKDVVALRFGIFEGYAGAGIDFDIPFNTDKFRWVTTLEAFDIYGQNHRFDRRPHLKWLNRMYLLRNMYVTFGADDFVSKHNSNIFLGLGLRFGDDDFKFFMPSVAVSANGSPGGFLTGSSTTNLQ